MSSVILFKIDDATGDVRHAYEVSNATAGALWAWRVLETKYVGPIHNYLAFMLHPQCWDVCNRDGMDDRDTIVCAFTYDGCWVARAHLPELAGALESFFVEHGLGMDVAPTLAGVAERLRRLAADETVRGVCFQQTSVTMCPWWFPDDNEAGGRPFTFGRDSENRDGRAPWELFDDYVSPMRTRRAARPVTSE